MSSTRSSTQQYVAAVNIRPATAADLGELFTLQRAAFVDEAWVYGTAEVPSLRETLSEMEDRLGRSDTIVAVEGHRIVGMVSLRSSRDGGPDIERLAVAPDRRHRGYATALMAAAEDLALLAGETAVQLLVGEAATLNRRLYDRLGYTETARFPLEAHPHVVLVSMTKALTNPTS